jgi:uncharacterized membrane protein YfcA
VVGLLLAVALIAAFGAFSQAVSGFGFAMVAVPLLTLVLGPRSAIAVATMVSAVLALLVSVRLRNQVCWSVAGSFTASALVGMPVGLAVLLLVSAPVLTLCIAAMVVVFAGITVVGLQVRGSTASSVGAGLLSGLFLTSAGMNGPPLVAGLHAMRFDPRELRATLQATFAVQDLLAVVGFAVVGLLTSTSWLLAAAALPGAVFGWMAGSKVFAWLPAERFRAVVVGMLMLSAAALVAQSFGGS